MNIINMNSSLKRELLDPVPHSLIANENEYLDILEETTVHSTVLKVIELDELEREATLFDFMSEYWAMQYQYIKEGNLLYHIFVNCLWKEDKTIKTFKQFCKDKLHKPFWQVKKTINASHIAKLLLESGFTELPKNESIANILFLLNQDLVDFEESKLLTDFEQRLNFIWGKVLLEKDKTKITGKRVKEVIKFYLPEFIPTPKSRKLDLKIETHDRLTELANQEEMTSDNLINDLIDIKTNPNFNTLTIIDTYGNEVDKVNNEFNFNEDIKEIQLLARFKNICNSLKVSFVDVLETVLKESTVIKLLSNHSIKPIADKLTELTIEQLSKRLNIPINVILKHQSDPLWFMAKDSEGIAWTFNGDNKFHPQLELFN